MTNIKTYIVDSFTDHAFKGNPAGVCLLENDLLEQEMQAIATELNLSETAFVKPNESGYSIRYFSPMMEIPLCGHATLASAKVLFDRNPTDKMINFTTIKGLKLTATKTDEDITMEFPIYKTDSATAPPALLDALGIASILNCEYNQENCILILEVDGTELLRNLKPDFEALRKSHDAINGVSVTAASKDGEFDFHSRYFWPWSGSNEDPVTGATHTFLASYWGTRLNKTKMKSFQSSKRSGFMGLELINETCLLITGKAVVVLEGTLRLPN